MCLIALFSKIKFHFDFFLVLKARSPGYFPLVHIFPQKTTYAHNKAFITVPHFVVDIDSKYNKISPYLPLFFHDMDERHKGIGNCHWNMV